MKNTLFAFALAVICLPACQKTETSSPATSLVGTWAMRSIEPSTQAKDDFFGPEFTFEIFNELFSKNDVVLTESGLIQLVPTSPETEESELGTLRYQVKPEQHHFLCLKENEEDPIVFTYRLLEDGKLEVVTDDGVRMVFLAR